MDDSGCTLEVDVNGQEVFFVNKKILSSFSGKLNKLFVKSTAKAAKNLKVIFHDFPGGAEGFELVTRFCYNNGKIELSPYNILLLHCVAHFMEMTKSDSESLNLFEHMEKSIEEIGYWSWSELLVALKQCQNFITAADSSGILQKVVDSVVGKLVSVSDESPSTSSPDSFGFRFSCDISCDTRSTESVKTGCSRANWWYEDLVVLNPELIERVMKSMTVRSKFDHVLISRFVFFYQKTRFSTASSDLKCKILETVIEILFQLDRCSVPCKSLFGILRVALGLNISKSSRTRLESMIGLQLDQATLDNLLVPAPPGVNCLYDVNLVLRFLKSFLLGGDSWVSSAQLKKVSYLMDMYIAEVAPDSSLKPSKFIALVISLPDSARDSYDGIYHAMDMYIEVHAGLCEDDKTKICSILNYEKLSLEVCKHLAQNSKFPSRTAIQALSSQQLKLKSLLQETGNSRRFTDSPCTYYDEETKEEKTPEKNKNDQIVLYARKLDLATENQNLKANLQGMQWRVMELEKVCKKMQTQMAKMMKSKVTNPSNARSLPRLCS